MRTTSQVAAVARVRDLFAALREGLVERELPLYLALLAALSGEHLLLVGPPGTAKSELARKLHLALEGGRYFERLLTRFTVPEEIFGPLSLKALERDEYERLTAGYLPTSHVAFLDEIFKANSAILNALLGILNEREIDNGARRERVPLVCLVAASNELPEGGELAALSDRFLVRYQVAPVSDAGFLDLLARHPGSATPPVDVARLALSDLEEIRAAALRVEVPEWVPEFLRGLRAALAAQSIYVSDRRWHKTIRLLRTSALLSGRAALSLHDLSLLAHCTWQTLAQKPKIETALKLQFEQIFEAEPTRYQTVVSALEEALVRERDAKRQQQDDRGLLIVDGEGRVVSERDGRRHKKNERGELLFKRPDGAETGRYAYTLAQLRNETPLKDLPDLRRYASDPENWVPDDDGLPALEPATYSEEHIGGRMAQVRSVARNLREFRAAVQAVASHADAGDGAWAPVPPRPELSGRAAAALRRLDELAERLARIEGGFGDLPARSARAAAP